MSADATRPMLCLSGEPAVRIATAVHALGAREAAILAWLAIEGETSRPELARLLWPDSPGDAARTALRQRIFQLRRIAGEPLVVGTHSLSLADGIGHDLTTSSGVLGGHDLALGVVFDSWLERQRVERRERSRRSLVERAERAEADADHATAISHARALLEHDPLSEDAHRRLIRLLYLSGERPAALLAFDRCEQVLKDEVGVAPGPETMTLLQTILRAEAAAADAHAAPTSRAVPAALLRPPRRVGRSDVWEMLNRSGDARVRLVVGEAGMGKSRLLLDLVQSPSSPRRALAVARPGDAAAPYALASRLLRAVIAGCGVEPTRQQRAMLGPVLPELGDATMSARSSGAAIASASAELLVAASSRGLDTVVVDDLQFADDASAEWLLTLIGEPGPCWIVATRPYPLRPAARAVVDAIETRRDAESVTLQPLTRGELGELLGSIGIAGLVPADATDATLTSLHRHTGGNPFHVLETVKASLARPGPRDVGHWPVAASVVRLVQQRLEGLTPLARSIARCAAIAGQDSDSRLVADVLGKTPSELGDAFAELEAAHLLGGDGQFPHDLVAEAALGAVPHAIEKPLHADVAQWLETHRDVPGRTAEHWLAAGSPLRAAPLLVAAGEQSLAAWRPDEAAPRFAQASSIYVEAGDRRRAFDALYRSAAARAQQNYGSHLLPIHDALLDLADDEGQLAMAAVFLVGCLIEQRRFAEAAEAARRAVTQAAAADLPEIESQFHYGLALVHWEHSEVAEAAGHLREVLRLLAGVPVERRLFRWHCIETSAAALAGSVAWLSGRYAEAEARFVEMRQRAKHEGDLASVRDFDRALSQVALEQGSLKRAMVFSESAVAVVERGLEVNSLIRSSAWRGHLVALDGDLGQALQLQAGAVELWERHQIRHLVQPLMLARLHQALGRQDLARARLVELRQRVAADGSIGSLWLDTLRPAGGERTEGAGWIDDVSRLADLGGRVLVLCAGAARSPPEVVLPALEGELVTTRDAGAEGLALSLQARRAAALHALGRIDEAAAAAEEAWRCVDAGISAYDLLLPDIAALLCGPLAATDRGLAQRIAERGLAWMQRAAATLPAPWRDNYLARAPALEKLRGHRMAPADKATSTRASR